MKINGINPVNGKKYDAKINKEAVTPKPAEKKASASANEALGAYGRAMINIPQPEGRKVSFGSSKKSDKAQDEPVAKYAIPELPDEIGTRGASEPESSHHDFKKLLIGHISFAEAQEADPSHDIVKCFGSDDEFLDLTVIREAEDKNQQKFLYSLDDDAGMKTATDAGHILLRVTEDEMLDVSALEEISRQDPEINENYERNYESMRRELREFVENDRAQDEPVAKYAIPELPDEINASRITEPESSHHDFKKLLIGHISFAEAQEADPSHDIVKCFGSDDEFLDLTVIREAEDKNQQKFLYSLDDDAGMKTAADAGHILLKVTEDEMLDVSALEEISRQEPEINENYERNYESMRRELREFVENDRAQDEPVAKYAIPELPE